MNNLTYFYKDIGILKISNVNMVPREGETVVMRGIGYSVLHVKYCYQEICGCEIKITLV